MISVTETLSISKSELEERFVRSPGRGGQNVNKVATAVQLRFDAERSPNLTSALRRRLRALAGTRVTKDGVTVISANRFRSQERNREDALERLLELLRSADTVLRRRQATRPSRAAKERRLWAKKQRGSLKKTRGQARDFN